MSDPSQQPQTQAPPPGSISSSNSSQAQTGPPTSSQPPHSSHHHAVPLYAQSAPHETQSTLAASLVEEAAEQQSQQQSQSGFSHSQSQFSSEAGVSQLPAHLQTQSAFGAAHHLAGSIANPVPYTPAPPYQPPLQPKDIPVPTGAVRDGRTRTWTDEEINKLKPEEQREVFRRKKGEPLNISEEKVTAMSVAELKRRGFGRVATGYCFSTRMTMHQPLTTRADADEDPHPEQPARIIGIFKKLEAKGLTSRMDRIAVREAIKDEILLVHSEGHWDRVRGTGYQSIAYLETCSDYFDRLSLYVNTESAICARLSCGGVIEMCRAVAEGQIRNGFAIVRPPGHHAEPEDAMGFCFFNNAAVAAKWLQTIYTGSPSVNSNAASTTSGGLGVNGLGNGNGANGGLSWEDRGIKKVLILDWDVHHGNGTQKAFWDDKDVLYISLHRHDGTFYPGGTYGSAEMVGEGEGAGFSVNIPFPDKHMTDADYIYAFQQVVMPIAYEFAPDFVIVSAGYDAAKGDELGQMDVTPAGFAHMTHMLSALANGKMVMALEGGYNVDAIANSAHACVEILLGDEPRHLQLGNASASASNAVQKVIDIHKKYWKCMGVAVESAEELRHAGKPIPISEALKAHRTYDLYHEYKLFNIELADPELDESYKDQLLCTDDVYDCNTLMIFMHDLGTLKAAYSAATMDIHLEKTLLLDTSREILDWAIKENKYGVVDVNFLAHLPTIKGSVADDPLRNEKREKTLALYIWDNIVSISAAQNVILVGSGAGCSALMAIVQHRPQVKERVKACISVLGFEKPPELDAASGSRVWYKENSLVLLPKTHELHEDARKAGKHQKKYGNVYRLGPDDEGRPVFLLKSSIPRIKDFVDARLPNSYPVDGEGDITMANAN
ncbi:Arginase/deacetylase [Meredithblackwellia eburnea MCA 4105]